MAERVAAEMSPDEIREFLSHGKLAVLTASGHPHVMPVWFVLDGQDIVFNTGASTVKGKHILRDGDDRAEEFGRRNGVPGELLVRLTPER